MTVGRVAELEDADVPRRIWDKDPTVWKDDPGTPEIADRLGWLTVAGATLEEAATLVAFAAEVRATCDRVVLCGMGGSSLAPEVLRRTFGSARGHPSLVVLDSTDPQAVPAAAAGDLARTLFLISSKSGTTLETDCFFHYFWELARGRGDQFVAITDPETPLARLAQERRFRRAFLNPPDIGGRYSALSYFGLVPAALLGIDVRRLLQRAQRMAEACAREVPAVDSPAARLGAILAAAALDGRDKLTFVLSPGIASLGLGAPDIYGRDRVFVALTLAGEEDRAVATRLAALEGAGHPLVRLTLADPYDVGQEFFRWEFATAVASAILRINPFDQPNVAETKANTTAALASRVAPAPPVPSSAAELRAFLAAIRPGDYLALMAYLPPTAEYDRRLEAIRLRLRDRLKVATTLGYGPRLLHSTGQLHKGGPPLGHFLQITEAAREDVAIPGKPFTFGALEAAQAAADLRALRARGRPALRVEGLELLER